MNRKSGMTSTARHTVGLLAPLPVLAFSLAFDWSNWVVIILLAVVVAMCGEWLGIRIGVLSATIATAGWALVDNVHAADGKEGNGGRELLVMALLIVVGAVFGTDDPPDRPRIERTHSLTEDNTDNKEPRS